MFWKLGWTRANWTWLRSRMHWMCQFVWYVHCMLKRRMHFISKGISRQSNIFKNWLWTAYIVGYLFVTRIKMALMTLSKCRTCTICLMCIIFPETEACQTQHCNECIEGCFQSIGCFKDQMEFATMLTVEALFYSPEHWFPVFKNSSTKPLANIWQWF